jgi:predicted dehydrogenase
MNKGEGESIRLIQAGMGGWGRNWYKNVLTLFDGVHVAAGVDADDHALSLATTQVGLDGERAYTSLERALERVEADAVVITASLPGHVPLALTALRAGKHVLVEKPFAPSLREADLVIAAAEKARRVLMVSQNYRFFPAPRRAAQIVRDSELGQLGEVHVDFRKNRIAASAQTERHYRLADPLLADMAIHHMDLMRLVTGRDPRRIYCRTWNPPWSHYDGMPAAAAVIEMEGGLTVDYSGSWVSPGPETLWAGEWRMEFERGEVRWTSREGLDQLNDRLTVRRIGDPERQVELAGLDHVDRAGSLAAFVRAVRANRGGDRTYENAGADNRKSLAMVFAAIESAQSGRPVEIGS